MEKLQNRRAALFFALSLLFTALVWALAGQGASLPAEFVDTLRSAVDFRPSVDFADRAYLLSGEEFYYPFLCEFMCLLALRYGKKWIGSLRHPLRLVLYLAGSIPLQMSLCHVVATNPNALNLLILFYFPVALIALVHYLRLVRRSALPWFARLPLYAVILLVGPLFNPFILLMVLSSLVLLLERTLLGFLTGLPFFASTAPLPSGILTGVVALVTVLLSELSESVYDWVSRIGEGGKGASEKLPFIDKVLLAFAAAMLVSWLAAALF